MAKNEGTQRLCVRKERTESNRLHPVVLRRNLWLVSVMCAFGCLTGCVGEDRIREAAANRLLTLLAAEASVDSGKFSLDSAAGQQVRQDLYRDLDSLDSNTGRELAMCIVNASRLNEVRRCRDTHWPYSTIPTHRQPETHQ